MRRLALVPLLICVAFCKTPQPGSRTSSLPGHGAISIQIVPNPIVAVPVGGNTYDFPVDIVVREVGGRGVTVSRVTATVYGPAGIRLGDESWDATQIKNAGYPTNLPGNGELRDRKSTRLNSSHRTISYAVFCLKKKKNILRPGLQSQHRD